MEQITKVEFQEWKENRITQEVFKILESSKKQNLDFIESGGTLAKESDLSTDFIVGRIQGINVILNIDYDDPLPEYGH